ncbi:hypothetical protein ACFOUV_02610 [Oceanobacillus longus]|uniref:Uncharacterized protein n=1 Tax=Oceanobacillus longus TaxID=930120 RepID=A0ABV8GV82_9BACI
MLNYQEKKYSPIDSIAQGYAERGTNQANTDAASVSYEALRKRFKENPDSLSPMELLTLGSYEYDEKNRQQSEQQQSAANEDKKEHDKDQEMISASSKDFQTLAENMAQMQADFQKMNGGEE